MVLDFIYNHTSDEHDWARRARAGNASYQDYYFTFDREEDFQVYAASLREVFPGEAPGNFSYCEDMGKWVWTTFKSFQWDLNYRNPAVFEAMAQEMFFSRQHRR